jgi:hypothetical protein
MNPQRYALIVAIVFAAIAVLQLARAVLGWPIAVTTPWGTLMIPVWLSPNHAPHGVFLHIR